MENIAEPFVLVTEWSMRLITVGNPIQYYSSTFQPTKPKHFGLVNLTYLYINITQYDGMLLTI